MKIPRRADLREEAYHFSHNNAYMVFQGVNLRTFAKQ